jgi:hypothetical protein
VCDATVLPHCGHLLSCGACQRFAALRVRNRIFDVLRFGTPIKPDKESRKSGKDKYSGVIRDFRIAIRRLPRFNVS